METISVSVQPDNVFPVNDEWSMLIVMDLLQLSGYYVIISDELGQILCKR